MTPGPTRQPEAKPKPPPFVLGRPASTTRSRHFLKALLYGVYGAGKTTLAATSWDVEDMRDVLFVDAEAGELALEDWMLDDVVRISSYPQLARIFEYLRLHCRFRDEGNDEELAKLESRLRGRAVSPQDARKYYTVVIDSLTEVQTYLMYQLLNVDLGQWALDITPDSPEYKEWGQSSEMIQLLVRSFRDLPMHVIFVCSEQEVTDDKSRLIKRPNLPGKLAGKVQGFLDLVGYLDTAVDNEGTIRRRLWLQPGRATFQAKHRFRNLDVKYIDDPTLKKLIDLNKEMDNNARSAAAPPSASTRPAAASRPATSTQARAGTGNGRGGSTGVRRGPVPAGRRAVRS
jgi:hypothetical protein